MCLTTGAKVPVAAQQTSEAAAAVVQLWHQWNIDAPECVPSPQSSEARAAAQQGHRWNIDAREFIPLQQISGAGAAAAQVGQKWNIDAPGFIPPQQISEARAAVIQLGQGWNVEAPDFVPSQQITEAGVVAQPGRRWNIHAPDFIPSSQTAVSQLAQGFMMGHPAPALTSATSEGRPCSAGVTGSTAAVPRAVTPEDAGHAGPPAVALPSPDDSSDASLSTAMELPVEASQQDVAECMHGMRWLQTLHENEVAERWLPQLDELNADFPEGYYDPLAEAYAHGRQGLPPPGSRAAATKTQCMAHERVDGPHAAAVSSNKALTVSQMVAVFAAAGGAEAAPLACHQPQPEEELGHAVDDLLAQSVNSLFLRGPHLPPRTGRSLRAKRSTARPQPQMSPGAALLHGAAAAWAVGHMATAAMALPSAAVGSPALGQTRAPDNRAIDISARAGPQPEELDIVDSQAQPVSPAGSVASLSGAAGSGARSASQSAASGVRQAAFGALAGVAQSLQCSAVRVSYYAAGAAVGIGAGLCLIALRRS